MNQTNAIAVDRDDARAGAPPPPLPDAEAVMSRIEDARRSDLAGQGRDGRSIRAETANLRWGVRWALANHPGDDAAARLRAALAAVGAGEAKRRQQVRIGLELLERTAPAVPGRTRFGEVLGDLLRSGLHTRKRAARAGGICAGTLNSWVQGVSRPSTRHRDAVSRLERLLGVEDGFLLELARPRQLPLPTMSRARQREIGMEQTFGRRAVRSLSEEDLHLPAAALREAIVEVARAQATAVEPFTRKVHAARSPARQEPQPPLSGELKAEVDAYCAASTSDGIDILAPFMPSARPRREHGLEMDRDRFRAMNRFLCHDPDGPGLPEAHATVAYLAFPEVVRRVLGAKQTRLVAATGRKYLTLHDIGLFGVAARLLARPAGFLFQRLNRAGFPGGSNS